MVGALLLAFALTQYADAISLPFAIDDYLFLDKTRHASFASLWERRDLVSGYYRPWSREFHFWGLQALAGANAAVFRVASLGLWLATLLFFFRLATTIAGPVVAAIAVVGAAVQAGWGVLLVWPSGAQDLWMLFFSMLFLWLVASGRRLAALPALALALLSKESAAVLPVIALVHQGWIARRPVAEVARYGLILGAVVVGWALFHPSIMGGASGGVRLTSALHPPLAVLLTSAALSHANLDQPVAPAAWASLSPLMLIGALLPALVPLAVRRATSEPTAHYGIRNALGFGAAWAVVGWAPLAAPMLGWHAYYGLFGAFGTWLLLGGLLARPRWVAPLAVGAVAVVRVLQAATPTADWGTEWYQRRIAQITRVSRDDLMRRHASFPRGARLYFIRTPGGVSFNSSTLRTWYDDPSLAMAYFREYRPRAVTDTVGRDYFFEGDPSGGWLEIENGPEVVAAEERDNPLWREGHQELAFALYQAGDPRAAAVEFLKLASQFPEVADYFGYAGSCFKALGDSAEAERLYARARAGR